MLTGAGVQPRESTPAADVPPRQAGMHGRDALPALRESVPVSRQSLLGWGAIVALFGATVFIAYTASERVAIGSLRENGLHRFDVYAASLQSELAKYDYLPSIAELNGDVIALLRNPADAALRTSVNQYLQRVNERAKSSAIYILDLKGVALAASNWNQPVSFVGMDLSYRPYFQDALHGRPGRFYGIGTTSGEPGYYFANGIYADDTMLGVATLKVSLDKLEEAWTPGVETVLVADANDVVFLASVPAWKFRTLAPLPPETRRRLEATRQYDVRALLPLDVIENSVLGDDTRIVSVRADADGAQAADGESREFLEQSRTLAATQWKLLILSSMLPVRALARNAALIAAFAYISLLLLFLYLRQRRRTIRQALAAKEVLERAHEELEQKVTERTADLREANVRLQREVAERERAEQVLRKAQDELVQAGKMAALGQMSAGITHELNQPLAAIRTMSDNAAVLLQRGRTADAAVNLATIGDLVDRMGKITGQLKSFARKSAVELTAVPVRQAVANALFIVDRRLRNENVTVDQRFPQHDVRALCVGNRLEQVLINLITNALDAMAATPLRLISISVREAGGRVLISVRDSGTGIAADVLPNLFVPFFTTKEPGVGLGLGLAISAGIVRDFEGTLKAGNHAAGGAEFVIELKQAPKDPAGG
jgi:two-component system C4-dicarboxylate transport sensor histidine kinase DctB